MDSRMHVPAMEGDRSYGGVPDQMRGHMSDAQAAYGRGRRPSRTGPKRPTRSRRSSTVISEQEQNLEVIIWPQPSARDSHLIF